MGDGVNKALDRAIHKRDRQHLYGFELGKIVVREPWVSGNALVCTLAGDPNHEATHAQADAICGALDKLMKKRGN
jgi:hypothetical protein